MTLRILHLEDSPTDRDLVKHALQAEGIHCALTYASSRAEFEARLSREEFDIILSDFTLPDYDGEAALMLAQRLCPDVPYVFVSGTIGEERAIESLKKGATDYVLKDRLDRLLPALRRALREAEERRKRRMTEVALRQAELRFRGIFENAVEGIYESSPDGRLLDANRAMARICGYDSPADLCRRVADVARDLYCNPQARERFTRLLNERGEASSYESQIRRADGAVIWISENARAVRDGDGRLTHYEGMVTNITERKRAEEALRRSEERFRVMAESIEDVFWISSADASQLYYVSPAYEKIWGRAVSALYAEPKEWLAAIVEEDRVAVLVARQQLAAGKEYRIEYRIRRPDDTIRWIDDRSFPIREGGEVRRAVGVAMDITQRKQLEAQLMHAQKMEAVGQLAGGVAHDFNNVLTVVTGYARLLLDGEKLPAETVEPVTQIYTAGVRAANLTRQLLLFSRKQAAHRRTINLNETVEEIARMLQRLIGEHIALKLALADIPCAVEADPGMMEQVIMNLAVNARDAMGEGGVLSIQTEVTEINNPAARRHPAARAGNFVSLSVRDTGCGIPPENFQRIFEPFFTTKEAGSGTGLGLATVFGIVQQHHGWVEVDSTVGRGTCFNVLLPRVTPEALAPVRRPGKVMAAQGGSETILLVEDETAVREFGVAVLRSHGYRVLQACSGVEALEVWRWHGSRIALLFSDLVMPDGVGGVELAATLRKEKPTLRVILASGYVDQSVEGGFTRPAGTLFLHKPYKPQVLAQTIRDALDGTYRG